MKRKIEIILLIVVTIGCIYLGLNTRKNNAIRVTQMQTNSQESLSYMIETNKNNIIMIDGGDFEDSERLENLLQEKGGIVDSWFITIAHSQNFGALEQILKNGKIQVNHIYFSFNSGEWYQNYEYDRAPRTLEFCKLLSSQDILGKVQEIGNRTELSIDNLYITALNVKNPDFNGEYAGFNQSMILKVDNTYKSMIFMGNVANIAANNFKDNSLDEIKCNAVQISNNGMQYVDDEIYKKMSPKYLFMSSATENRAQSNNYLQRLKTLLNADETYLSADRNITVNIK